MIGFWRAWGLVVGMMIGSGIYTLPAVLAPFGIYTFWGWALTLVGVLSLVVCLMYLAHKYPKVGAGGPAAYVLHSFGRWPAIIVAWGYWISLIVAIAAIAVSFVGYAAFFIPVAVSSAFVSVLTTLVLVWMFTWVCLRGTDFACSVQLFTSIVKILPLVVIGIAGVSFGQSLELPTEMPANASTTGLLAQIMLLIMWSYIGIEAATLPADTTDQPQRTIPRAVLIGTLSATFVYGVAVLGVMKMIPAQELANSSAPMADAAELLFGGIGGYLVAFGAIIAIGGTLNACIFLCGVLPSVFQAERMFPKFLSRRRGQDYSSAAIVTASAIASLFVLFNAHKTLVSAFSAMIVVSTVCALVAYLGVALAAFKQSLSDLSRQGIATRGVALALIALIACVFAVAALFGAV